MGKKTEKILKDARKQAKPYQKEAEKLARKKRKDWEKSGSGSSSQGLVIVAGVLIVGVIIGSAARKKKCGCKHC